MQLRPNQVHKFLERIEVFGESLIRKNTNNRKWKTTILYKLPCLAGTPSKFE